MGATAVLIYVAVATLSWRSDARPSSGELLGADKCTYGPSYWCDSLDNARECDTVKHCSLHAWKHPLPQPNESVGCELCQYFIKEAEDLLKKNGTKEHIYALLDESCEHIPDKTLQDECKNAVKKYLPEILSILASDIPPLTVCQLLKLCKPESNHNAHVDVDTNLRFKPSHSQSVHPPHPQSSACDDCVRFIKDIRAIITNRTTVEEFESLVIAQVCSKLGPLETACQELVKIYGPQVLTMLANQINPVPICQTLGFCASDSRLKLFMKLRGEVKAANYCADCITFMDDMKKQITSNTTVEELETFLDNVLCNTLGAFADECRTLVTQYAPLLLKLLANKVESQKICDSLGLCNTVALKNEFHYKLKAPMKAANMCADCINFIDTIKKLITSKSIVKEIEQLLGELCDETGTYAAQCHALVDDYLPLVLQYLTDYLNSTTLCDAMGLCKEYSSIAKLFKIYKPAVEAMIKLVRVDTGHLCEPCVIMMNEIKHLMDNKTIKAKMEAFVLDGICSNMGILEPLCSATVKELFPGIYDRFVHNMDSQKICCILEICNTSSITHVPHRLTAQQVTQTRTNAVEMLGKWAGMQQGEFCTPCVAMVNKIKQYLTNNTNVKEKVEKYALEFCNEMGIFKNTSKSVAQDTLPWLYDYFINSVDAHKDCYILKVCNTTSLPNKLTAKDSYAYCQDCNRFLTDFKRTIDDHSFSNKLQAAVDRFVCEKAWIFKPTCTIMTKKFVLLSVNYLFSDVQPSLVCKLFKLCPYSSLDTLFKVTSHPRMRALSFDKCEFCQVSLEIVRAILTDSNLQKDLTTVFLKEVCPLMKQYSGMCTLFVTEYMPILYKMIDAELNPKVLCQDFHACNSTGSGLHKEPVSPADSGTLCMACKGVAETVYIALQFNQTKQLVINYAIDACKYLPKSLASEFTSLLKIYGDYVLDLIIPQLQPDKLCHELGLCSVSSRPVLKASPLKDGLLCTACKDTVFMIDEALKNNYTMIAMKTALNVLCDLTGPKVEAECKRYIDEYAKEILEALAYELNPGEICADLRICDGSARPEIVGSGELCEVCEWVMKELDALLTESSTRTEIKAALDKVCGLLPSTIRDECVTLVDRYTDMIIDMLAKGLSPQILCKELGLCASKTKGSVLMKLNLSDDMCDACKYIATYLSGFLKEKATEAKIKTGLLSVCNDLPPNISTMCRSLVNEYSGLVLQYLADYLTPERICSALHLCQTSRSLPKMSASAECEVCKMVVEEVDTYLKKNSTKAEIKEALDVLCNDLPATYKSTCVRLVNTYTDIIINNLLMAGLSPSVVCEDLKLCTSQLTSTPVKHGMSDCAACETGVKTVKEMLAHNTSRDNIKTALEDMCHLLPMRIRTECKGYINEFLDDVIKMIRDGKTPAEICTALGLPCSGPQHVTHEEGSSGAVKCEVCEMVIGYLYSLLKANSTEADIKAALDKVCGFLPEYKSECEALVNQYTDEIIKAILNGFTPDRVCSDIGLCPSKLKGSKVTSGSLCVMCELVMTQLDNVLKGNYTKEKVKDALDKVCHLLPPSVVPECERFVDEYSDKILKLLITYASPSKVCTLLHLCQAHKVTVTHEEGSSGAVKCEVCEMVIGYLYSLLKANSTEADIKAALDKVCGFLPEYKSECEALVNQYTDEIIKAILNGFTPDRVCSDIGLCPSKLKGSKVTSGSLCVMCELVMTQLDNVLKGNYTKEKVKDALDKVCHLLPPSVVPECERFVDEYSDKILKLLITYASPSKVCTLLHLCQAHKVTVTHEEGSSGAVKCEVCEMVIGYLYSLLKANSTEADIKAALDKVCGFLPEYKSECEALVNQYTDEIIKAILNGFTPDRVCSDIGLCPSKLKGSKVTSGSLCVMCELVMTQLDNVLKGNYTKEKVKDALDKVCHLLPPSVVPECERFVDEYSDKILKLLITYASPSKVCTLLHLCQAHKVTVTHEEGSSGAVKCEVCEMVIGYLYSLLKANSTEADIKAALDKVCGFLPEYKSECEALVNQYTDEIIKAILNGFTPDRVCSDIGLCPSKLKGSKVTSGSLCVMCELVMTQLDNVLKGNYTKEKVKDALDKVCHLLPPSVVPECERFVDEYSDKILKLLITYASPSKVCTLLHLCQAHKVTVLPEVWSGVRCGVCRTAVTLVYDALKQKSAVQAIVEVLQKFCDFFPSHKQLDIGMCPSTNSFLTYTSRVRIIGQQ